MNFKGFNSIFYIVNVSNYQIETKFCYCYDNEDFHTILPLLCSRDYIMFDSKAGVRIIQKESYSYIGILKHPYYNIIINFIELQTGHILVVGDRSLVGLIKL